VISDPPQPVSEEDMRPVCHGRQASGLSRLAACLP